SIRGHGMPRPVLTAREPDRVRTVATETAGALRKEISIGHYVDHRFPGFRRAEGEVEVIAVVAVVAARLETPVPGAQSLRMPAVVAFVIQNQFQRGDHGICHSISRTRGKIGRGIRSYGSISSRRSVKPGLKAMIARGAWSRSSGNR